MSDELLTRFWRVRGLRLADRLVLAWMSDFARDQHGNTIWMKQINIAERVALHPDTVKDALARLTERGHLSRQVQRGRPTVYVVHPIPTEGSETPHSDAANPKGEGSTTAPSKRSTTPRVRGQRPPGGGVNDPSITTSSTIKAVIEPKGSARAQCATRLSPDWNPVEFPPESIPAAIAGERGETWIEHELAKFRDYWAAAAGQRALKMDWQATWRTWITRAHESAPHGLSRAGEIDRALDGLGFGTTRPSPGLALRAAARAAGSRFIDPRRDIDQAARDLGFKDEWSE